MGWRPLLGEGYPGLCTPGLTELTRAANAVLPMTPASLGRLRGGVTALWWAPCVRGRGPRVPQSLSSQWIGVCVCGTAECIQGPCVPGGVRGLAWAQPRAAETRKQAGSPERAKDKAGAMWGPGRVKESDFVLRVRGPPTPGVLGGDSGCLGAEPTTMHSRASLCRQGVWAQKAVLLHFWACVPPDW